MGTYRIKHLLTFPEERITTCNNDLELIQFVNRIQTENDDELTFDVDSAIDYINLTCDNLDFQNKEVFTFHFDQKHTIWLRSTFEVFARTKDDAKQMAIQMYYEDEINSSGSEYLTETLDSMTPEQNGDASTIEILLDGEIIYENVE